MEHQLGEGPHPSVSFHEGENSVSRSGENYVSVVTKPISWQDRSWNSSAGLVAAFRHGQPSQSGMIRALVLRPSPDSLGHARGGVHHWVPVQR
jgi:hypothetical protein